MATILAFDRRARINADLTPDQVLRQCRLAAITRGCSSRDRQAVEDAGRKMLASGVKPHQIIEQAKFIASQLAPPTGPEAA